MAGLCAAARARELGASPTVLEKGSRPGGFYYVVVAYLLFTLFRGPFASSVTTIAHTSAIYLAVMVATSFAPRPLPAPPTETRRHECASST